MANTFHPEPNDNLFNTAKGQFLALQMMQKQAFIEGRRAAIKEIITKMLKESQKYKGQPEIMDFIKLIIKCFK